MPPKSLSHGINAVIMHMTYINMSYSSSLQSSQSAAPVPVQAIIFNDVDPYNTGFAFDACAPKGASTMSRSNSLTAFPPGPVCSFIDDGIFSIGLKSTTRSSFTAKTVSVSSQGSSLGSGKAY